MKKSYFHRLVILNLFIAIFLGNSAILCAQKSKTTIYPIPDEVNNILKASCISCHGEKGGRFPKTRLNISKWNGYGASKEIEKAEQICSVMKKGSMPPKSAREKGSVTIPTKEQIDIVCQWAQSLKQQTHKK